MLLMCKKGANALRRFEFQVQHWNLSSVQWAEFVIDSIVQNWLKRKALMSCKVNRF